MAMIGDKSRPQGIFDSGLEFKDAGLVAASAAAEVDAAAKIVDIGTGLYRGKMNIDVSAIEIADNNEIFTICVQLSNSATFASLFQTAAKLELGAHEVLLGDIDSTVGRYKIYFDNEFDGTYYRYARIYTVVAGTVGTGINYTAWCTPQDI